MQIMEIVNAALLSRDKIPWHARVEPEQVICIDFADMMRTACQNGSYRGIWGHLANEGKRHELVALILIAMGMIPGSPDHYFIGPWGGGVIEFKTLGAKLRPTQELYRDWCIAQGVRHAVAFSPEQAIETLKKWGAIKQQTNGENL